MIQLRTLVKKPDCDPWTIVHNDFTKSLDKKVNPNLYLDTSYVKMKRHEGIKEIKEIRFDRPISGIYILCYNREIKYIGQSSNILARIALHISGKGHLEELILPIDEIYYEQTHIELLNIRENYYIETYEPELNTKKNNGKYVNSKYNRY